MPEIPIIETELVRIRRNPRKRKSAISKKTPDRYRVPKYEVQLVREGGIWVDPKHMSRPSAVFELAQELVGDTDREHLYLICMDRKNKIIGVNLISTGTLYGAPAHPREVMKVAILLNSATFILFHNHPSGSTEPSPDDLEITRRMKDAGDLMGIQMLDHIIVGEDHYLSIFENYPEFWSRDERR